MSLTTPLGSDSNPSQVIGTCYSHARAKGSATRGLRVGPSALGTLPARVLEFNSTLTRPFPEAASDPKGQGSVPHNCPAAHSTHTLRKCIVQVVT